ncbi:MAG: hypothetical protein FIO04_06120 [Nitrosopumilales archaeon]|nr:hypothetical protein [Nitrosopumilales archaeon]
MLHSPLGFKNSFLIYKVTTMSESQEIREIKRVYADIIPHFFSKIRGMVPAIYENGTHFVTNQKLTLEMLREISDSNDVLEVAGEYTGNITARGSSHVHSDDCPLRNLDYAY